MARQLHPTALVIVDPNVDQYAHFAYEIAQFAQAELFILDEQADGIEQITTTLTHHQALQSLHLILPSECNHFRLGNAHLTAFNLDRYGWDLQQWGEAFAPQAQIFLHRWNMPAEFEVPNLFLTRLSLLTGAKVAITSHLACVEDPTTLEVETFPVSS